MHVHAFNMIAFIIFIEDVYINLIALFIETALVVCIYACMSAQVCSVI